MLVESINSFTASLAPCLAYLFVPALLSLCLLGVKVEAVQKFRLVVSALAVAYIAYFMYDMSSLRADPACGVVQLVAKITYYLTATTLAYALLLLSFAARCFRCVARFIIVLGAIGILLLALMTSVLAPYACILIWVLTVICLLNKLRQDCGCHQPSSEGAASREDSVA